MLPWILKIVAVIALLGVAAAIATPKGRLPLALRGLQALVRKDRGLRPVRSGDSVSPWKRLLAFLLTLVAVLVTVL